MTKKFKYLILGSNGLLGNKFKELINKKDRFVVAKKNSDFDFNLENKKKLKFLFKNYQFNYVINCAAYTNLDYCENNYKKIKKINSFLPKYLAKESLNRNFKLIHISSDQVYLNNKKYSNKENSKTKPINKYARSKIISEVFAKINKKNLIIRTNFTGFKNKLQSTFVGWILHNLKKGKKMYLFNDIFTSTLDVNTCAKKILNLIDLNACGIFNLGAKDNLSKMEFAIIFAKMSNLKIIYEATSSSISKVNRSKFLVLNSEKAEKKLKCKMISSKEVIGNLINQAKKLKLIKKR